MRSLSIIDSFTKLSFQHPGKGKKQILALECCVHPEGDMAGSQENAQQAQQQLMAE